MHKGLIHFRVSFPTYDQSSVMSDPRHRALNLPAVLVAPEAPAVLDPANSKVPLWSNQLDPLLLELSSQVIRIIGFIPDQTLRLTPQTFKRCPNQRLLMRTGRVKGHCQRNSFAVCHHHKLRTLTTPCDFGFWAPFFAATKWPSIKHWTHPILRRLSSSRMKLCQSFSQIPWSSQSLKRLQQVLGLGYSLGKSFQRAPLLKTQRIPSSTARLFFQGRPLLFNLGSRGSIFRHCFSLK